MEQTNYIKHLNNVLSLFSKDNRLNPSHISLYMALFQIWNDYHFEPSFYINRAETMDLSKLGSKITYHRCIKELSHWKYILYEPSNNPFRGSKIKMFNFGTSSELPLDTFHTKIGTTSEQVLVSKNKLIQIGKNNTNNSKQKNNIKKNFEENEDKQNPTVPYDVLTLAMLYEALVTPLYGLKMLVFILALFIWLMDLFIYPLFLVERFFLLGIMKPSFL